MRRSGSGRTGEGTRFRLFPEYASGYAEPEIVVLSPPAGSLGPGPSDDTAYVANAAGKRAPYAPPDDMPPWRGAEFAPALPGPEGHFDHLPVESRQFLAAHLYGTMRHTLDVWESYLCERVRWWHADFIPRLELVPVVWDWANAHSGPGFIETGMMPNWQGREQPLCLNFDVIAHETGHAMIFAKVGAPPPGEVTSEYLAFHESFADLTGLIAALRFPSVVRRLLLQTEGNLYVLNLVSRLGELSSREQVRIASNSVTMDDVRGLHLAGPDGSWFDPLGRNRNQHALAEPLTGAIFDILVEIYQDRLAASGAIPDDADVRGWTREEVAAAMESIRRESARGFARFSHFFAAAVEEARDVVGQSMANVLLTLTADTVTFPRVAARFLEAACALGEQENLPALLGHFLWRGIDPRPHLTIVAPHPARRRFPRPGLLRATGPASAGPGPRCCEPHAFIFARRLMPHGFRARGPAASF